MGGWFQANKRSCLQWHDDHVPTQERSGLISIAGLTQDPAPSILTPGVYGRGRVSLKLLIKFVAGSLNSSWTFTKFIRPGKEYCRNSLKKGSRALKQKSQRCLRLTTVLVPRLLLLENRQQVVFSSLFGGPSLSLRAPPTSRSPLSPCLVF